MSKLTNSTCNFWFIADCIPCRRKLRTTASPRYFKVWPRNPGVKMFYRGEEREREREKDEKRCHQSGICDFRLPPRLNTEYPPAGRSTLFLPVDFLKATLLCRGYNSWHFGGEPTKGRTSVWSTASAPCQPARKRRNRKGGKSNGGELWLCNLAGCVICSDECEIALVPLLSPPVISWNSELRHQISPDDSLHIHFTFSSLFQQSIFPTWSSARVYRCV